MRTTECSCRLWPSPGMYAVTSMPPEMRTRATLRSAEFGFFSVVVYTRVQTPRRCGAATFFLRPLPDFRPGVESLVGFQVAAPCKPNRAVDVHARARRRPGRSHRLVLNDRAGDPDLAQRPVGIADEERGDDRLGMALGGAPVVKPRWLGEQLD